jgi:exopolysaccharide biosynthesis protein
MDKKPLLFLFFVSLAVFILFFVDSGDTRKVPLMMKRAHGPKNNRLTSVSMLEKNKHRLNIEFQFRKKVSYEIQYSPKDRHLTLFLYNLSKRRFKKLLKMNKDYFSKILLSYSTDHVYRIVFLLKQHIMPLPYASKGRSNPLKLSFSKSFRAKQKLQVVPRVELSHSPTLSHLSRTYRKQKTRKPFQYQTQVQVVDYQKETIEPGIQKFSFSTQEPSNDAYGFKIHHSLLKKRFTISLGQEQLLGVDTLSSMSKSNEALLGINGSYFMANGDPIGLLIKNYQLLSSPVLLRSCFGILEDGKAFVGRPEFQGEIVTEHGILLLEGLNQLSKSNATLLYTPEFGLRVPKRRGTIQISIKNNEIVKISEHPLVIPRDGFIISLDPRRFPWFSKLKPFSRVVLSYGLTPPWTRMKFAIGGGPRLIDSGRSALENKEHFKDKFLKQRAPRSAIGIDELGNVIFLVVDGRRARSPGLSIPELADIMKRIGSHHALNLDGGGSSTLYYDGEVLNKPSDGSERKLSNAILVLRK